MHAPDLTVADALKAQAIMLMGHITPARGHDTRRARDDEIAYLDAVLDAWLEVTG